MGSAVGTLAIYLPLILLLGAAYYNLVRDEIQRYLIIYLLYVSSSITISTLYLAMNAVFVTETARISTRSFAFAVYIAFNALIMAGMSAGAYLIATRDASIRKPWRLPSRRIQSIAATICLLIAAIELVNVLISYPNGFSGVAFSRALFFQNIAVMKFLPSLFGVLAFFIPIISTAAALAATDRWARFAGMITVVMYFLYMRGIGQVFHGMLFPGSMVIGIYLILRSKKMLQVKVPIRSLLVASSALVLAVVINSFANRGISTLQGGALGGMVYRILVLQGSSSAEIYNQWVGGSRMEIGDLLSGRDYWISKTMPESAAAVFMELGTNLQGSIPGSFLSFGGYFGGGVLCLLYGMVLAASNYSIIKALQRGAWLALFPASYLWVWGFGVYSRASLEELIKPRVVFMIALYFILLAMTPGRPLASSETLTEQSRHPAGRRFLSGSSRIVQ